MDLSPGRLEVGRRFSGLSWMGQIADIRLWKIALTAADIAVAKRYQQPALPNTDLVSYWPLGAESLNTEQALDIAGENTLFSGGLAEARWPGLVALDPADTRFLRSHRRALTTTNTSTVVIGNNEAPAATLQRRTVEVWFWAANTHIDSRKQVIYHEGDRDRGLSLYLYQGSLYYWAYDPANGWAGSSISTVITSQRWYHVALVLDGRAERRQQSLQLISMANWWTSPMGCSSPSTPPALPWVGWIVPCNFMTEPIQD